MPLSKDRLKRLVRHRERAERLQEERLAEARRKEAERKRAVDEAEARRDALFEAGAPGAGQVDPGDLAAATTYLTRLKREIGARQAALAHSAEEVEAERMQLMERRRDVKAMETLLDHQVAAERLKRSRADIKHIDEQAGIRWLERGEERSRRPSPPVGRDT